MLKYSSKEAGSELDHISLIDAVRLNNCHQLPEVFSRLIFCLFVVKENPWDLGSNDNDAG